MANIEPLKPLESLGQTYERLNKQFKDLDGDIKSHKSSAQAHNASTITYEGDVPAANVQEAINKTDRRISSIVAQAGDSNTEIVDARGGAQVLGDRLNGLDAQLAETDTKIDDRQPFDGDLVALLQSYSTLKDSVIVKVRDTGTVDIGVFYGDNKATIYTMKPDGDGFWRLFDVINRPLTKVEKSGGYKKSINYESTTGTWNTSSPPFHYTTEIGATFTGSFDGTGFIFNHRSNNAGGLWEFVIDGYLKVDVSVWSETDITQNYTQVVSGLSNTRHFFVATFKGADPNHPPTGTARGWCHFYNGSGTQIKTISPTFPSYENQSGIVCMQASSRKEFAFQAKPNGASYGSEWFPEHGVMNVLSITSAKIFFGEIEISDLSLEPDVYYTYPSVRFLTKFDARHPSDVDTVLWKGRLDQVINGRGYHIRGRFNFMNDTWVAIGYPAMLAYSKTTTDNDRVVVSDGTRYIIPKNTNDNSNVVINGDISSLAHFTNTSNSQTALNTVAAIKLYDYKRIMRKGLNGAPTEDAIVVRLRSDGERKSYFQSFLNHVVYAGETYDFGCTYFCGEITDASEILPG